MDIRRPVKAVSQFEDSKIWTSKDREKLENIDIGLSKQVEQLKNLYIITRELPRGSK